MTIPTVIIKDDTTLYKATTIMVKMKINMHKILLCIIKKRQLLLYVKLASELT